LPRSDGYRELQLGYCRFRMAAAALRMLDDLADKGDDFDEGVAVARYAFDGPDSMIASSILTSDGHDDDAIDALVENAANIQWDDKEEEEDEEREETPAAIATNGPRRIRWREWL
jgi:hypothetical protein